MHRGNQASQFSHVCHCDDRSACETEYDDLNAWQGHGVPWCECVWQGQFCAQQLALHDTPSFESSYQASVLWLYWYHGSAS